jgi:hypothetical protein
MRNIDGHNRARATATFAALLLGMLSVALDAHGVSGKDAVFLQGLQGRAIGPLLYLGAKHMVTGYDHLLFLVGVIFFLYKLTDVVQYVSLFTLGHSATLLMAHRRWAVVPHASVSHSLMVSRTRDWKKRLQW